jgi:hypothetical protein
MNMIGIPSGWEEFAAFFMNGQGRMQDNVYFLKTAIANKRSRLFAVIEIEEYDWTSHNQAEC